MPEPARLAGVQELVLGAVLGRCPLRPEDLDALILAPPAGTRERRWHVYATGLVARAEEALANDFPAVAKVLGEGPLRSLTARYLRSCAPRSHDLGRLGDRLARFLESDQLTEALPFLPDLARLEWAVAEAFVAADTPALEWGDLTLLGPEGSADVALRLREGSAVVRSAWPIREIWACRHLAPADIDVPVSPRPSAVLVTRRGLDVLCRAMDEAALGLLGAAAAGLTLASVLDTDAQDPTALVTAFRQLVEDGAIARPRWLPPAGPRDHGGQRSE